MTDDQRWDTLWAMPIVQEKLVKRGVNFVNAFVSSPECCPSRASFLAGGFYAHHTAVLTNELPNGGAARFADKNAMPVRLQQAGYRTALIGKYLNSYDELLKQRPDYVPPGWTTFVRDTTFNTDLLRDKALAFLDEVDEAPFFLYFAPHAPHPPATPRPDDRDLFPGYVYRGRGFHEADLTDKPAYVQWNATRYDEPAEDLLHRKMLQSLQGIDRAVGSLVDKLTALGRLDSTLIVFTSDNGYLWGEHGLAGKMTPHEEAIRVPLVMVLPAMGIDPREERQDVVSNLDVPSTIFALAGIDGPGDGLSLVPLLSDPINAGAPRTFVIEGFRGTGESRPKVWAGLRNWPYKYVEYATGETELYDLLWDPHELRNQAANGNYAFIRADLERRLSPRKGLAILQTSIPNGRREVSYSTRLTAWGGRRPYRWKLFNGSLPEGLSLDETTGTIRGRPLRVETKSFGVKIEDSSVSPYTNRPQIFIQRFAIAIQP
jgi:arylsulfatase A-like enzyme